MSDDPAQEKTEQATPKRQKDSKDKGQVARSRELNTTMVMIAGATGLIFLAESIVSQLSQIMTIALSIDREFLSTDKQILRLLGELLAMMIIALLPLFFILIAASLVGPVMLGGWSFSVKSWKPKLEKLSLLKGLKRQYSLKSLVELGKALAKFIVIATVAISMLSSQFDRILSLSQLPYQQAMTECLEIIGWTFLLVSCALIIIAGIDIPFQLYDHSKKIKMTKQEVRDESKESEGKPEVKGHIRRVQQEMAQKRMMSEVPNADVVVTNPTHYAVALKYDQNGIHAPRVVAKGQDLIAEQIKKTAAEHNIITLSTPPLARALFFNTKLNQEIPRGLFVAVAHVLAYVYQLKRKNKNHAETPKHLRDLPIPDDLRR